MMEMELMLAMFVFLIFKLHVKKRKFTIMCGLLLTAAISTSVNAQIRVVSYNSAQFNGDADAMVQVLQAATDDDSHGYAIPVSIFLFQEVDEAQLSTLQTVVGVDFTMATFFRCSRTSRSRSQSESP